MSDKTGIEWCDSTWNPVTGCTKVSEGCRHCYAATFAERWRGTPGHYFENGFDLTLRPDKLDQPLKWTRPRKIFVNSMSDLFHKDIPDEFIADVFAVMSMANQHTFQVLTKRPDRMQLLLNSMIFWIRVNAARFARGVSVLKGAGPVLLPNVWLGVSVENQKAADERIPLLLQTPAAVRFLSCEPLLGPLDLEFTQQIEHPDNEGYGVDAIKGLDWVICGAESGHGARPMNEDWVRSIRDQCEFAGTAFFYKQNVIKGKKIPLPELDGQIWNEFPQ